MKIEYYDQQCEISHLMLADSDIASAPWDVDKFTGMVCTQSQSSLGTRYYGYILGGSNDEGFWVERYFDYFPGGPLYVEIS